MGYRYVFVKYMEKGLFRGLEITESMPFVNDDDAQDWMDRVNRNPSCDFRVKSMLNVITGSLLSANRLEAA